MDLVKKRSLAESDESLEGLLDGVNHKFKKVHAASMIANVIVLAAAAVAICLFTLL